MTVIASMKTERKMKINLLRDFRIKVTPEIKAHMETLQTPRELERYTLKLIDEKLSMVP